MTPLLARWVQQSIDDPASGDCVAACLSSLTGLEVPNFSTEEDWFGACAAWLEPHGWQLVTKPGSWVPRQPAIAGIMSPTYRTVGHAVIVLGRRILWDPSSHRNDPGREYGPARYHIVATRIAEPA